MLGAFVVLAGCSSDDDPSTSDVVELVDRYVAALDAGEVGAAMDGRCERARIPDDKHQLFAEQVARLRDDAGGALRTAAVVVIDDVTLQTLAGTPGVHEVQVTMALPGGPSAPVRLVTVVEGGEERLCGWRPEESADVEDSFGSEAVRYTARHIDDLRATLPVQAPPGERVIADGASTQAELDAVGLDPEESWSRAWQRGDYGGSRASLFRFDDTIDARDHLASRIAEATGDSVARFDVPGIPSAVGLRTLGFGWTWVQTSDYGPAIDTVRNVYDDTLAVVAVSDLTPDQGHEEVLGLITELDRRSG